MAEAIEARVFSADAAPVQSGPARRNQWIVEFEPISATGIDALMGWSSSSDVRQQVRLVFGSLAAAEEYCRREHLPYTVTPPRRHPRRPRPYSDNFLPAEGGGARNV